MKLVTERMELIPLTVEDLGIACFNPEIIFERYNFLIAEHITKKELQSIYQTKIQHMLEDPKNELFSTYFWMKEKKTNRFMGEIGFKGLKESFFSVEVGYGIVSEFEGSGYTTEALKALVKWAFEQQIEGLLYVIATTGNTNIASQRVLEKVGFKQYSCDENDTQWMIDSEYFRKSQVCMT